MKKTFRIILIIFIVILFKLIFSYSLNSFIISNYDKEVYNNKLIKFLYIGNFPESYIAYYNEGNILYKQEKYQKALDKYQKALRKWPSKKRVCDIRVNISLSMLKLIDTNQENEKILNELKAARENLYENGCANEDDDSGKSYWAEELEEEIRKLEEQYQQNNGGSGDDSNNEPQNEPEDDDYSDLEEEYRERERKSNESRQEDLDDYQSDYHYYDGDKW